MAHVISGGQLTAISSPFPDAPDAWGPIMLNGPVTGVDDLRGELFEPLNIWAEQPSVRKVVDFIARAVASTPLKLYRRVSDTDRQRVTDGPLAAVLGAPSPGTVPFRFWHSVIVDWLLFDRWVAVKAANDDPARPLDLVRVQAQRVTFGDDGLGRPTNVWVDGKLAFSDIAECLFDHGYAVRTASGTSPMRTLSAILQESREAVAYRRGVWKNAGRIPAVLSRPAGSHWTPEDQKRFIAAWRAYTRGGGSEGGTPILEDGMTLTKFDAFTPRDTQDIEGRQLNDAEVASAYHIAPELVGARPGNYSNMQAFREMLYGDTLGPYYEPLEQVINAMLVPDLDPTGEIYAEYDIEAKMRGSFETQAAVMSTATGRPWLLTAEARAKMNLPDLGGNTHDLVTPLNVLIGGQASPRDSGSQNIGKAGAVGFKARMKARAGETYQAKAQQVLTDFFDRQRKAVLAELGTKAAGDWWDADQWNGELSDDLYALSATVSKEIGAKTAESLGFTADDYDVDRTLHFLRAVADSWASNINAATLAQIQAALASDDEDVTPAAVFDDAKSTRSVVAAASLVTAYSGFATTEAGRQIAGDKATKTWDTGPNARASHAAMNGETVGIDELFSNGLNWPGDGGDADEVAGCNCGVTINVP